MTELPLLSGEKIVRALSRAGYSVARQRGSHIRLTHPSREPVTVPAYKQIDRSLLRKILRDDDLSPEEFIAFAKTRK